MTFTELWLAYQLASRFHEPTTKQLIELDYAGQKLADLEDVLEHVFREGFVDAKHRPSAWWETKDGHKLKASHSVHELLNEGLGRCPESAVKLVVQDVPPAMWFTYVYTHNASAPAVTQRVKLTGFESSRKIELLAHVTNHIFANKYIEAKHRAVVHWETPSGQRVEECTRVDEVLSWGSGTCEEKPLRLVINAHSANEHHHHHHQHHHHEYLPPIQPHSPCTPHHHAHEHCTVAGRCFH